jgi:signal transduction histidine kinase
MSEVTAKLLLQLSEGRLPSTLPDGCEHREQLSQLVAYLKEVQALALAISRGELAPRPVVGKGPVLGSLKALQASLRHLTWQTQRVAEGDLTQQVDFMGEFATAFNEMVRQLADRKRLEIHLRQAQKLEAIGQLAAGIAHEINTPAQYVGDNLDFLKEAFGNLLALFTRYRDLAHGATDAELRPGLADIAEAEKTADLSFVEEYAAKAFQSASDGVARIAAIVGAVKEFAHPDQPEMLYADLNRALAATLTIATNQYQQVADVETSFGELPPVRCYASQVNQVFLNLLVNAAQAIETAVGSSGDRGRITIRTSTDGEHVKVEFADTGCGIPEAIRERVYDPFFTTRDVGQGRGQGLTVARAIVVNGHQGSLTFQSAVGVGTTFTVVLPIEGGSGSALGTD